MGYNWAADSLVQSVGDALGAQAAESDANRELRQAQRVAAQLTELELSNAANLAEKHALKEALMKVAPNHPMLQNVMLQEKIREAGKRAFSITRDWDAARNAGATFKS